MKQFQSFSPPQVSLPFSLSPPNLSAHSLNLLTVFTSKQIKKEH